MYRSLDPEKIVETAGALRDRIAERFPGSGLSNVGSELLSITGEAAAFSHWLDKPLLPLRFLVGLCIVAIVGIAFGVVFFVDAKSYFSSLAEFFQGLDAAINDVVFIGIAIYFLLTWETRLKRRRALKAIHVLRSLAHIIDMHQLTKDPEGITQTRPNTKSSPKRVMTPFELMRYLDYCSESLSLISKVGALYVQNFTDPVTVSAVNEIEDLSSGLSRKIWQKIMILDRTVSPNNSPAGSERSTASEANPE